MNHSYFAYPGKIRATRVNAMKWWNELDGKHRKNVTERFYPKRIYTTLTGFEIQQMFEKK